MIAVHPAYKTVQEAMDNINTHGLGIVNDAIRMESTSRLNGDMSLSLEVPLNEYNINLFTADNLICLNGQYYRIQRPERSDERGEKRIRLEALHVFFDLQKSVIENIETKEDPAFVDGITAEQALNQVLEESEFSTGMVDLSLDKLEYLDLLRENRFNAIKQILDKWGGEIYADNWTISLYKEMGEDRGVVLDIAQNTDGIRVTEDISKVVTRLYPYGYQETNIESVNDGKDYLDSPNIDSYARILEGYAEFNDIDDPHELKRQALEKLDELDKPDITVAIDMIKLKKDPQWAFFDEFIKIELGDIVSVPHMALKNNIKLRVLEIIRDELTGAVVSLKLGNAKADGLFRGFASTVHVAQDAQKEAKKALRKVNGLNIKADAIEAISAKIREIVAGQITTDQLYADLAAIAVAQITTANIDYAKIVDMATDTAIITKGEAGKLYIANLAVTDANMVQLTAGALMLKAEDGSFVQLVADGAGGVSTAPVEVEGDNIAEATIPGGKLIEKSITARELNVQQIFADEALIRAIKAKNLDVADLFAAEATISELNNYILRTNTIEAIKGELNVWAEDKISIAVGNKADKEELTSATNDLQSQINAVPGQITAEVSNIRIGGVNIMRGTRDFSVQDGVQWYTYGGVWRPGDDNWIISEVRDGFAVISRTGKWSGVGQKINYKPGRYIFSAFIRGNVGYNALVNSPENDAIKFSNNSNSISIPVSTQWERLEVPFIITRNAEVFVRIEVGDDDKRLDIYAIQIEEGTKATDWTPHPLDVYGGSNLLEGSKFFDSSKWLYLEHWNDAGNYNGFQVKSRTNAWRGIHQGIQAFANEIFTFSFYIRSDVETSVVFFKDPPSGEQTLNITAPVSTSWTRRSISFVCTDSQVLYPRVESKNSTDTIYICGLKLERGTVATPWDFNPDDPSNSVKTSHITIEDDRIDIATGGKLNMQGGSVNLEAGSDMAIKSGANFDLITSDFGISNNRADKVFLWAGGHPAGAKFRIYEDGRNTTLSGLLFQDNNTNVVLCPQIQDAALNIQSTNKWVNLSGNGGTAAVYVGLYSGIVNIRNNLYVENNVSAASFTDRTPAYRGDALKDIKMIVSDDKGNIDHSTLPMFARRKIKVAKKELTVAKYANIDDLSIEEQSYEEVEGRDIGAMVSVLTTAIQQLAEIVEKQGKQIEILINKVNGRV